MKLFVNKITTFNGRVTVPASKSQSIRAIFIAALSRGESILRNILQSDDTQDAISACKHLGVGIHEHDDTLIINSNGLPFKRLPIEINSGNSGLTTHFLMPILGLKNCAEQSVILNCGEQMRKRPIKGIVDALNNLGLNVTYLAKVNTLPVKITGKLRGGKTHVDGMTSQYLSALLLALPCVENDSEITVEQLRERPYVEMTLSWLKKQGIQFTHQSTKYKDIYHIKGGQGYRHFHAKIAGDFSSASSLIAASVLIPGKVIIDGLNMSEPQGDKRLISILRKMGADITITPTQLIIHGGKKLTGVSIDASDIPDLLPVLAVIGAYASGRTQIVNVKHARYKETDRIHSMCEGLRRMGANITEHEDGLTVCQSILIGCDVKGFNDHRTVMALSLAGMIAEGETVIDDCEAINKTYPTYLDNMRILGAKLEVKDGATP